MGNRESILNHNTESQIVAVTSEKQEPQEEPDPFPSHTITQSTVLSETKLRNRRQNKELPPHNLSQSEVFRKRHFPSVSPVEWNDWRWQLRNRITSIDEINRFIKLSGDELKALTDKSGRFPVSITPYYMSCINPADPSDPIRRSMIPVFAERIYSEGEADDPLGEDSQSPVHGLVHRYPDRVLFLSTNQCAAYCRYCTRSRMVGQRDECKQSHRNNWELAFKYIKKHTEIRDVLISGGDPLTMPDEVLEYLLINLRAIPHVEIVRIGTKVPMVLPQRITSQVVKLLKQFNPLWINIHCTHPLEITPESSKACNRLADAGIPLGSQTVLLKGINDSAETLKQLYHKLLTLRIRPYYLYQCDPISGSAHFRTPVQDGISIIRQLRGFTTGFAVPQFVIDAPGGGGKIPVNPDYAELDFAQGVVKLRNYNGQDFFYPGKTVRSQ